MLDHLPRFVCFRSRSIPNSVSRLLPSGIMSFCKLTAFLACLSSGAFTLAQAPAPTAAPAKDPRITQIITRLEAVRAPHETAISHDNNWVAWVVNGKERSSEVDVAPTSNPSAIHRVT